MTECVGLYFKGVGLTFRLNFRLKGYVSRQHLWTAKWGNGYAIQFCRWKFHTKTFCSRLYSIDIEFYSKNDKNRFLSHSIGTPSIARWKTRGRLPFRHNLSVYVISYGWDVISGNLSNSTFFEGVGHFERKFQPKGSVTHQPLLVPEN